MFAQLTEMISKYGFPIIAAGGMGYFVYYVWHWVTTEVKPVINETNNVLITLIDRVRCLDNDLLRLNQKLVVLMELKGKPVPLAAKPRSPDPTDKIESS